MLIYSMSVSVDGFIADREGAFGWTRPERRAVSLPPRAGTRARRLSVAAAGSTRRCWCGRRIRRCATTSSRAAFADVWCAIPKVVFSRTLDSVQGNARLAQASLAEEIAAALDATDKDVQVGGAGLAAQAIELGLVDELRMFRHPVVVGGGTPFLPPVTDDIALELIETPDGRLARDLRALQARAR